MPTQPPGEMPFGRIGIAGLGLIGGSVALKVRAVWPGATIVGLDHPAAAAEARRRAVIDETAADVAGFSLCDLIVLATPVSAMVEMLPAIARTGTRAIVTDVGSTKRDVMAAAHAAGLRTFVGGHPMAGGERGGLEHARADLFEGRAWLVIEEGQADARARVEAFVAQLGARPLRMAAEAHDRAMAYVSHVPQIIAVAMMNAAAGTVGPDGLAAAGPAFTEMTRVAASPVDLWQGILSHNADFVGEALEAFLAQLPAPADAGRAEWVSGAFERARAARERWKPSNGPLR